MLKNQWECKLHMQMVHSHCSRLMQPALLTVSPLWNPAMPPKVKLPDEPPGSPGARRPTLPETCRECMARARDPSNKLVSRSVGFSRSFFPRWWNWSSFTAFLIQYIYSTLFIVFPQLNFAVSDHIPWYQPVFLQKGPTKVSVFWGHSGLRDQMSPVTKTPLSTMAKLFRKSLGTKEAPMMPRSFCPRHLVFITNRCSHRHCKPAYCLTSYILLSTCSFHQEGISSSDFELDALPKVYHFARGGDVGNGSVPCVSPRLAHVSTMFIILSTIYNLYIFSVFLLIRRPTVVVWLRSPLSILVVFCILGVAWHLIDVLHHLTYSQIIAGKGYFEPLLDLAGSHCNSFKPFVLEH